MKFQNRLLIISLLVSGNATANQYFMSATLDNDLFVGEDNGYTNGVYFSFYTAAARLRPTIFVQPLVWSMPNRSILYAIDIHSIGQTLTTAEDITLVDPPEDSLPYSALLKYTNAFVTANAYYADWVSTSIGLVGPNAKGEQTQNGTHRIIGVKEAKGWDTQLNNEIVFSFSRGRVFRLLANQSDTVDLLIGGQLSLGTIESGLSATSMIRVGRNLKDSYSTILFSESRTSNPIATNNSWFVYAGLSSNYVANQIYTDGNTFSDSRSIDYDHNYNTFTTGLTYSIGRYGALSLAYHTSLPKGEKQKSIQTEKLNEYGTLTFSWKI